jgi:hypothetical protein
MKKLRFALMVLVGVFAIVAQSDAQWVDDREYPLTVTKIDRLDPLWDPNGHGDVIPHLAKHKVVIVQPEWMHKRPGEMTRLRTLNPNAYVLLNTQICEVDESNYAQDHPDVRFSHYYYAGVDPSWWLKNAQGQRIFYYGGVQFPMINITIPAARQWYVDWLVWMSEQPEVAGKIDGYFVDVCFDHMSWYNVYGPFDLDGDGFAESPAFVDAEWKTSIHWILEEMRRRLPPGFIFMVNGLSTPFEWANGEMDEDFEKRFANGKDTREENLAQAGKWQKSDGPEEKVNTIYAYPDSNDYQYARFAMTSAWIHSLYYGGLYRTQDNNDPSPYFDEFDVNLGKPTSEAIFLPSGVEARTFENGLLLCNPNTALSTVDMTQFQGTFRRIQGTQDPDTNNGELVQSTLSLPGKDGLVLLQESSTGVAEDEAVPTGFALHQNYPNPFNPSTEIRYGVGRAGPVTIKVYNMRGQEIRTLVDRLHQAGSYNFTWNGRDQLGQPVASGVYIYQMLAPGFVQARKLNLSR